MKQILYLVVLVTLMVPNFIFMPSLYQTSHNISDRSNIDQPEISDLFPESITKVWINIGPNLSPLIAPDDKTGVILVDAAHSVINELENRFQNDHSVIVICAAVSKNFGLARFTIFNVDGQSSSLHTPSKTDSFWARNPVT